jgi:4-hydroxy-tetrahydrodipicolinate synthase
MSVGDFAKALEYQDRLMPLHKAIFIEPGVAGTKYALSKLGMAENVLRAPITPIETSTQKAIDAAMVHAGLIN